MRANVERSGEIGQIVADAPDLGEAVERIGAQESVFFSDRFLAPRPLLEAVRSEEPVVLLVDEIDRHHERRTGHAALHQDPPYGAA